MIGNAVYAHVYNGSPRLYHAGADCVRTAYRRYENVGAARKGCKIFRAGMTQRYGRIRRFARQKQCKRFTDDV